MKKEKHLDVSYKYFLCVRSFHDFNEMLNEILSVIFLDIKKNSKIFLYLIIFSPHFSTSLLVFLETTFRDLPRIRAGSCQKHLVT